MQSHKEEGGESMSRQFFEEEASRRINRRITCQFISFLLVGSLGFFILGLIYYLLNFSSYSSSSGDFTANRVLHLNLDATKFKFSALMVFLGFQILLLVSYLLNNFDEIDHLTNSAEDHQILPV